MTVGAYLRNAAREARGQGARMAFFIGCLAVGVAGVTAVAGLAASLEGALRADARQLLAADLMVEGRRPAPAGLDALLATVPGASRSDVRQTATVVSATTTARSLLVQLKAVEAGYPFYGALELTPAARIQELLASDGAVVAPEVLAKLGIGVGDALRIGGRAYRVNGIIRSEPDRLDVGFSVGPRVFIAGDAFQATGLAGIGSQVSYRALIRLPEGTSANDVARRIRAEMPDATYYEVQTYSEAQPGLRNALRRAESFLGLVALLSLLVGGMGVGRTVSAWLAGRMDAIAIRKVLGMRPGEVLLLYLGQTVLLAFAGSLAGAAAGIGIMSLARLVLAGLVNSSALSAWQPAAAARGIALGLGVAVLFALPPLLRVRRVPPLRVLRRDLEPLASSTLARGAIAAVLVAGVFGTAWMQSGSIGRGAGFTAGLALALGVLALAALGLARLVGKLAARAARMTVRYGLASLARPGADTLGSMTALGLGTLVVLGMHLVEGQLARSLRAELPHDAPSVFFADIQSDQWPAFRAALDATGAVGVHSSPVVNARLAAVDARSVKELAEERTAKDGGRGRRWALTREQNLTYAADLPGGNRIIAGRWWNASPESEVSVEREFALEIGARVGSLLEFDVQGVRVQTRVANIREVEWGTFRPNFFMVLKPGALDDAPQFRVAAARLPLGREQEIQDRLALQFPNVVAIRVREMLDKVAAVLERAGKGVRFLGAFTVVAGIAILAGAVSAASARRGREVALLKTLGMTRMGIIGILAVEYALVGCVSGCIGAIAGGVLAWAVVTQGMELHWLVEFAPFALAVLGTTGLTVVAGVLASWPALSRPPLRELG